jgi:hypothetical protein
MLHWHLPLRESVRGQSLNVGGEDAALVNGLSVSLAEWFSLLPFAVMLAQPTIGSMPAKPPLIHVKWVDLPPNKPHALGWTRPSWDNYRHTLKQLHIYVVRQPLIDRQLSASQQQQRLRTTLLHEAGHALGLDHSHDPHAIMHARGWQNTMLSPGDKHMLLNKYGQR